MGFSIFTNMYNHHHGQFQNFLSPQKETLYTLATHFYASFFHHKETTNTLIIPIDVAVQNFQMKRIGTWCLSTFWLLLMMLL